MTPDYLRTIALSRRDFLATTAAYGAASLAAPGAFAQRSAARYRRMEVSDPEARKSVESYKKAIRAMLALPPEDPRNWYRVAFTHTLDCPHGNWWFVVWHRGYVGWFEQICRTLSEDPTFALPYWDWTKSPRVPAVMFEDVLTPNDAAYIPAAAQFKTRFESVLASFWNGISMDQRMQLLNRGLRFPEDLWYDINDDPRGLMFFDQPMARGLTAQKPEFDEVTAQAVSKDTVLDALKPRTFIDFGSPKTRFHSGLTGFALLEGSPHNLVHNCVGGAYLDPPTGGFMQNNLSPVDPLFFLHHANIDRLWDVWTRKQQAYKDPILPDGYETPTQTGTDWDSWSKEPFLFFVDSKGSAVAKTKAGDYAAIGDFDYDYAPGSGEEIVPPATATPLADRAVERFTASIDRSAANEGMPGSAIVRLPPALLRASPGPTTPGLFAKVTLAIDPRAHPGRFRVLVNAPGDAASLDASSPHFAGAFAMFGHHLTPGPISFTVPLTDTMAALRSSTRPGAEPELKLSIVPEPRAHAMAAHRGEAKAEILSVVVEAY